MVLLKMDTRIMNAQLGRRLKPQRTYPTGVAAPYFASGPLKGWKNPSCSLAESLKPSFCNATISSEVAVVMFNRFVQILMGAGSGSISKIQSAPTGADQALQRTG